MVGLEGGDCMVMVLELWGVSFRPCYRLLRVLHNALAPATGLRPPAVNIGKTVLKARMAAGVLTYR